MIIPISEKQTVSIPRVTDIVASIIFFTYLLPGVCNALESAAAVEAGMTLRAEQWEAAREGERILALPALQQLVNTWDAHPHQKIELRYPGGEEGELWVEELKDWLIALGVPSAYLGAVPGSGEADVIHFQIIQTGD